MCQKKFVNTFTGPFNSMQVVEVKLRIFVHPNLVTFAKGMAKWNPVSLWIQKELIVSKQGTEI